MANKMLIDATHAEETRVVVVRGNRVEEFDFEAAQKKQIKGNIYLAKVTRVEPSLQACFVDYGGNRHGFLAFSEIHPDYYQIPVADRLALIEEEARLAEERANMEDRPRGRDRDKDRNRRRRGGRFRQKSNGENAGEAALTEENVDFENSSATDEGSSIAAAVDAQADDRISSDILEVEAVEDVSEEFGSELETADNDIESEEATNSDSYADQDHSDEVVLESSEIEDRVDSQDSALHEEASAHTENTSQDSDEDGLVEVAQEEDVVEAIGGTGDAMEELSDRPRRVAPRRYKIQEVIKRRQVILVQVVKEERGNKGAALTTYLSLAGRYSVLMPNTPRGGGISRKITNMGDRKRLKEIAGELEVPEGMGVIVRTAGAARTKVEVKRDFEYLMRLWENVAELTLQSQAPTLVYEEGSLIKRSIRDLYNKDIDDIHVAGEHAYKEAKDFMRMLMPSHTKHVISYRDETPIFSKYAVESQLDQMFQTQVQLRSGGYIVINQTEALVSVDVNSGRATREHNIEDTALKTNLEAAEEISRQLRLRDLAGLIVIDFIDMEEHRNNRTVERKLKDCLRHDRARIQVGRISHFGLLEMSRQRIRTSVFESTTETCTHCHGTGFVRSPSSAALQILRMLEERLIHDASYNVILRTRTKVALYILNQKRGHVRRLEERFGVSIFIDAEDKLPAGSNFVIERGEAATAPARTMSGIRVDSVNASAIEMEEEVEELDISEEVTSEEEENQTETAANSEGEDGEFRRRNRRRRGRGRGRFGRNRGPREDNESEGQEAFSTEEAVATEDQPVIEVAEVAEKPQERRTPRRRLRAQTQNMEGDDVATLAEAPKKDVEASDEQPQIRIPSLPELEEQSEPVQTSRKGWWSKKLLG